MLLTFHSKPGNSVAALTGLHMKSLVIRGLLIMLLLTMQKISAQDSLIIKGTITKSFNGRKLKLSVIYPHRTSIINPEVNKLSTIKNGRFSFAIRANTLGELYNRLSWYRRISFPDICWISGHRGVQLVEESRI